MEIIETIRLYATRRLKLTLNEEEYLIFKRLYALSTEYINREAKGTEDSLVYIQAVRNLSDIGLAIEYYDTNRNTPIIIHSDAAVLLTRDGHYVFSRPSYEFRNSDSTNALISKIHEELGLGNDGYSHDW